MAYHKHNPSQKYQTKKHQECNPTSQNHTFSLIQLFIFKKTTLTNYYSTTNYQDQTNPTSQNLIFSLINLHPPPKITPFHQCTPNYQKSNKPLLPKSLLFTNAPQNFQENTTPQLRQYNQLSSYQKSNKPHLPKSHLFTVKLTPT